VKERKRSQKGKKGENMATIHPHLRHIIIVCLGMHSSPVCHFTGCFEREIKKNIFKKGRRERNWTVPEAQF